MASLTPLIRGRTAKWYFQDWFNLWGICQGSRCASLYIDACQAVYWHLYDSPRTGELHSNLHNNFHCRSDAKKVSEEKHSGHEIATPDWVQETGLSLLFCRGLLCKGKFTELLFSPQWSTEYNHTSVPHTWSIRNKNNHVHMWGVRYFCNDLFSQPVNTAQDLETTSKWIPLAN